MRIYVRKLGYSMEFDDTGIPLVLVPEMHQGALEDVHKILPEGKEENKNGYPRQFDYEAFISASIASKHHISNNITQMVWFDTNVNLYQFMTHYQIREFFIVDYTDQSGEKVTKHDVEITEPQDSDEVI